MAPNPEVSDESGPLEIRRILAARVRVIATWVHATARVPCTRIAPALQYLRVSVMTIDRNRNEILRFAARYGARPLPYSRAKASTRVSMYSAVSDEWDHSVMSVPDSSGIREPRERLPRRHAITPRRTAYSTSSAVV